MYIIMCLYVNIEYCVHAYIFIHTYIMCMYIYIYISCIYIYIDILCLYIYMEVFKHDGSPTSSFLMVFSIRNHPFGGTTTFGNPYIYIHSTYEIINV